MSILAPFTPPHHCCSVSSKGGPDTLNIFTYPNIKYAVKTAPSLLNTTMNPPVNIPFRSCSSTMGQNGHCRMPSRCKVTVQLLGALAVWRFTTT
ncbi:hypothetical protein KCP78_19180 [Salmonella enterica subsp. enterica]|nr:hypothetical protein KCP78_19180 [Salmonella enterica subsp. enterica]